MPVWITIAALTLIAGLAVPAGAAVACFERIRPQWLETELRHTIIAFGGGVLLSAVALVLVPEGMRNLPLWMVIVFFAGGGITFFALDRFLASFETSASQLVAMLADFIPEAIALGASFASSTHTGKLLALLIALQNLPEGFNACRELLAGHRVSRRRILIAFSAIALLGPAAGLAGFFFLSSSPEVVSCLMLLAAGGILYIVFRDIAPQAVLQRQWAPQLGAVAGFLLGIIGEMILSAG